jgi:alpha-glucuronidase
MDRTVATGTGYIGQDRPEVARMYESLETCPDDLLLFMHHVPYSYKLHSGKTVVQYIYDSHYEGADAVAGYARQWKALKGLVDEQRYNEILVQLEYQAGQAIVWRDAVTNWFQKASKIADAKGRVGHYPGRTEAESMELDGYTVRAFGGPPPAAAPASPTPAPGGPGRGGFTPPPVPEEDASGGKIVVCQGRTEPCTATMKFSGEAGWYTVNVEYFDLAAPVSHYRLFVNKQLVDEWAAALHLPSRRLDSGASARRVIPGIALRPGDEIRIEGKPDGQELAALDYVEITK